MTWSPRSEAFHPPCLEVRWAWIHPDHQHSARGQASVGSASSSALVAWLAEVEGKTGLVVWEVLVRVSPRLWTLDVPLYADLWLRSSPLFSVWVALVCFFSLPHS